ncbi:MAG: hypothetical protein A2Y88_05530 [Chloroflexi bacterium RBG_13_48_10]|nr:MAG: hypothetical protein A2Y88_05530 [Chloroflexi bacterium RBG_13_48_10]
MTKAKDEFGKRILSPLQTTAILDPQVVAEEKASYLLLAENLRQGINLGPSKEDIQHEQATLTVFRRKHTLPLLRSLAVVLIAIIILFGTSLTVYAAQDSLPGESLYPLKVISEDIQISLTRSPEDRLDITLDHTNRRVEEITSLLAMGKTISPQSADRFEGELEGALLLAAQMEDRQMHDALWEIKSHAESQGMTLDELINKLPGQAEPALLRLQERLREQISLSSFGEIDPKTFRWEIRERHQNQSWKHKFPPMENDSSSTPTSGMSTPLPSEGDLDHKKDIHQPTQAPGHDDSNPGQGNQNSGNGNHGVDPTRTQKP